MTVVNPKSISGINSITMASGSDNLLTIHTTNTTERVRVNSDGDVIVGSGITVSPDGDIFATGVCTATSFVGDGSALTGVANTDVVFTDKLSVGDAPELISVGVGSDFQISHNGGTGNTNIIQQTGSVYFYTGSDLNLLLKDGAEVALYHANTKQCETSANGLAFPSGKGIDFNATADGTGSSQAEILDDYEEGSWTPAVASGNASFSTMTGSYTKIGNQVTLWFKISGGGSYSGSSTLQISGIPFANNTPVLPVGSSEFYKIAFATGYTDLVTPTFNGNNILWLRQNSGSGSGNNLLIDAFYSSASITTTITYITNS